MRAPLASSRSGRWSTVYAETAPELAGFLTKIVGDRELAADLLQDTFVRALRAEASPDRLNSPRAWLFRIALNLARDHHRRRRLLQFVPFSGRERDPSELADPDIEVVFRALRALPIAQATALLLHYDAGFSRTEIAAMEGVGEEAIKSRLSRGRERFIRTFQQLGGTF